ncbi:hypothetical protein CNMCM7691_006191 [Aspergillus felis]|uniref:Uncharacterized protein n=1 Tax=Aspergillus felis TaxID=1287682 RepID=A0A8H6QTQ0_9EURO|nr:hypothetical protein CNMCM7691_006191 [Aspergillus felis]
MAAPHRSTSPCLSRLRAINDRMDRLRSVIEDKLTLLEDKTHELRRVDRQLTEVEVSERRRQIQTEREKLAAVMDVFGDMLNQMLHALDLDEEEVYCVEYLYA